MADLFGDEADDDNMLPEEAEEEEDILDMDGDTGNHQADSLLMRFCPHDSSMLYPQVRLFRLIRSSPFDQAQQQQQHHERFLIPL